MRWRQRSLWLLAPLALLGACSTPPRIGATRDGPPAQPPSDLITRPDPQPQVEPIRAGGPNKPYEVLGQRYTPLTADLPLAEAGLASWYGRKFHGRPTASGEVYDMYATTAAHRTMPLPSYALVRNPANGRQIVVRVNDRGPFEAGRVIDLSYTAALKLDLLRGVAPVEVRRLTHDDIRSARWQGGGSTLVVASAPAPAPVPALATAPAPQTQTQTQTQPQPPAQSQPTSPAAPQTVPQALVQPVALQPPPPPPAPAAAQAPGGDFWVQLGAFRLGQGAHDLRQQLVQQLDWLDPLLVIVDERAMVRLQAGPFATRGQARDMAERIRDAAALLEPPLVLQRR
jgi:rare lipoprotein A